MNPASSLERPSSAPSDSWGGRRTTREDATQFFPVQAPGYIGNTVNLLASLRLDLVVLRSSDPGVVEMAERADAMPVINGGSQDDHPTQALADIYTLRRELGAVDGATVAVVGRLEHRNVSALAAGSLHVRRRPRVDDACQRRSRPQAGRVLRE